MKIEVVFSAENSADVTKLIATLAAYQSGTTAREPEETPVPDTKKTRKKKEEKEEPQKGVDSFDSFDDDEAPTASKIDLEAVRTLVNDRAQEEGLSPKIRATMGSFNINKLSELKPSQFDNFYKAIKAL